MTTAERYPLIIYPTLLLPIPQQQPAEEHAAQMGEVGTPPRPLMPATSSMTPYITTNHLAFKAMGGKTSIMTLFG